MPFASPPCAPGHSGTPSDILATWESGCIDKEAQRRRDEFISSICSWDAMFKPSSRKRTAAEIGDLSSDNNSQMSSTHANMDGQESVAMKEVEDEEMNEDDGFQLTVETKEAWKGLLPPTITAWHDPSRADLECTERLRDEEEEEGKLKPMSLLVTDDQELLGRMSPNQFNVITPSSTETVVIRGIVSDFTARLIKQVDIQSPLKVDLESHLHSLGNANQEVVENGKRNRLMNQAEGASFLLNDNPVTLTRLIAWEYACKVEICLQPVANASLDHVVVFESHDLNGERTSSWTAPLNANTIDLLIGQLSERIVKAITDSNETMAQLGVDQSME